MRTDFAPQRARANSQPVRGVRRAGRPSPRRPWLPSFSLALWLTLLPGLAPGRELGPEDLPPPQTSGGKPLMTALKQRRTLREFAATDLSAQELSDLLWAAFGINRPEEGRRTAPSAMNSQEIDLYIALERGLYVYQARPHRLRLVTAQDLRSKTSGQSFSNAPVVLILVADLARLEKAKPETRPFYAGFDAGCICQNIYLYCASTGLATVVHDLNRDPLALAMGLGPEQKIMFAQAVGHPANSAPGQRP